MKRLTRVLYLALGAIVLVLAVSVAWVFYEVSRLRAEVGAMHASFREGDPVNEFKVPSRGLLMIDAVRGEERCLFLFLHDTRATVKVAGADPADMIVTGPAEVPGILARHRDALAACDTLIVTAFASPLPYRGTVKVHYAGGRVTRSEPPYFWD